MRTMIDLGKERGPLGIHIINTATAVDCGTREVGLRRSLRSLLDCVIPACCAAGFQPHSPTSNLSPHSSSSSSFSSDTDSPSSSSSSSTATIRSCSSSTTTVKGTFFGQRNGRVSFCLQDDIHQRRTSSRRMATTAGLSSFSHPLLLLEFAIPTSYLAKEMQHGLLRIALVEEGGSQGQQPPVNGGAGGIFQVPVWCMYCNGRKVGFATRRKMTAADTTTLTRMQSVSVGAGVLPPENNHGSDGTMYLRANFRRIIGSPDSESFHMINPDRKGGSASDNHSVGQELSIFLLRSSS